MTYRVRNFGLAAGLALAAVVLIAAYLTNYKRHVQNGERKAEVYVASKPIPAGTAGSDLVKQGYVRKTTVLRRSLVPGFVTNPTAFDDLYVTRSLFQNEQVSLEALGKANARGVQGRLTGTDRAFEVTGTPEQLLAGTLRDGDHVDVVASWGIKAGSSGDDVKVSRTILRDLLVLRAPEAGTKAALTSSNSNGGATIQLKMSDTEARQLFWMKTNGEWWLTLRSPLQAANGKDAYDDAVTLLMPALPKGLRAAITRYQQNFVKQLEAKS